MKRILTAMALGAWFPLPFLYYYFGFIPPLTWFWVGLLTLAAIGAHTLEEGRS